MDIKGNWTIQHYADCELYELLINGETVAEKVRPEIIHLLQAMPDIFEALKHHYDTMFTVRKLLPLMFNVSTPEGKRAWELYRDSMIEIEHALNKAESK